MNASQTNRFDIAICGGSFVGLALARALCAMAPGAYSIAIIEQRPFEKGRVGGSDGRTVALTSSVKAMLDVIGVWAAIADKAQPVLRIELTDSALEVPVRPPLIGLDANDAPGGEPTAYIVENADLLPALATSLESAPNIAFFAPDSVVSFETGEGEVAVRLASGAALSAKLLVAADGRQSKLRDMARHSDHELALQQGRHRRDRGHGAASRRHRTPAFPACRSLCHTADDRKPGLHRLDGKRRRCEPDPFPGSRGRT